MNVHSSHNSDQLMMRPRGQWRHRKELIVPQWCTATTVRCEKVNRVLKTPAHSVMRLCRLGAGEVSVIGERSAQFRRTLPSFNLDAGEVSVISERNTMLLWLVSGAPCFCDLLAKRHVLVISERSTLFRQRHDVLWCGGLDLLREYQQYGGQLNLYWWERGQLGHTTTTSHLDSRDC